MRVLIYTRTSKNGGDEESIEAQHKRCSAWAEGHGHEVVGHYPDDAVSGKLPLSQRPGLGAAVLALEAGEADGLVVHRLDRLARVLTTQEAILAHLWGMRPTVAIFEEASGGEVLRDDPEDPYRTAMRQMAGVFAELERAMVVARLAGGRRRKRERGEFAGGRPLHPRYGYRVEGGRYVPVEDEQATIRRMLELRDDHKLSYRDVCTALTSEGFKPPASDRWTASTVERITKRERPQVS